MRKELGNAGRQTAGQTGQTTSVHVMRRDVGNTVMLNDTHGAETKLNRFPFVRSENPHTPKDTHRYHRGHIGRQTDHQTDKKASWGLTGLMDKRNQTNVTLAMAGLAHGSWIKPSHHLTSIGRRQIQRRHHRQCTHTHIDVWVDVCSSKGTHTDTDGQCAHTDTL
uniref:Uncharacterized protein n=1 Tax=Vitrella brassicaformis TaxID=1169539 RepID=A0A7S1JMA2_9ALVE|mmetsp:Transcript_15276/g.36327  ORF Transcript_15276/g.36327 Transcript_15276/m.36327 type:complete len:165 (+) Transcript_15276:104-598(+)